MAETQVDINYPVYLGVWTNWSIGGRITGSTITLNRRDGALLTAFLAIFVTFTGSRLWRIICFISHQVLLSKPGTPQDGLYHQRQAILRNANDEKVGFLNLSQALWAWHQRAYRPFKRMIPIIGLSLFIAAAFPLGSIFSSKISSGMGNEVLISSSNCGTAVIPDNSAVEQVERIERPWEIERVTSYANYVQRCYPDSAGADSCTPFVRRKLSSTVDRNASCPFDERICRKQHGNIRIDTGYIDPQAHIGLNTPIDLQFKFRKVLQCAPIVSRDYQKVAYFSPDKPYMRYFYGALKLSPLNITQSFTYEVERTLPEEVAWRQQVNSAADAQYEVS